MQIRFVVYIISIFGTYIVSDLPQIGYLSSILINNDEHAYWL